MYYLQSCGGAQVRPEVVKADGMVNIMMVERTLDRCGVTHRNRYWTLSSPVTVLLYTILHGNVFSSLHYTLHNARKAISSDIIPCIVVVSVSDVSEVARLTVRCSG